MKKPSSVCTPPSNSIPILLKPLGIALSKLEELDAAEASHRRALAIEPESEEILYDLPMILVERGKASQALPLLMPTLERTPTWTTKIAFVRCVERLGFKTTRGSAEHSKPNHRTMVETAPVNP